MEPGRARSPHFILAEMVDVQRLPPLGQDLLFLLPLRLLSRSPLSVLLEWGGGGDERTEEKISKRPQQSPQLSSYFILF